MYCVVEGTELKVKVLPLRATTALVAGRGIESPVWVGTLARLQPIVLGKSSPYTGYSRPVGWVKV